MAQKSHKMTRLSYFLFAIAPMFLAGCGFLENINFTNNANSSGSSVVDDASGSGTLALSPTPIESPSVVENNNSDNDVALTPKPISENQKFAFNMQSETAAFPILSYLHQAPNHTNGLFAIPTYNATNDFVFRFLASRVISLRLQQGSTSNIGTATILAKASNDPQDHHYYVATNLHVAQNFLLKNNYQVGFAFNPYFDLAQPNQQKLLDQNTVAFSLSGSYLRIPDASPASLVWSATNIHIADYDVLRTSFYTNIPKQLNSEQFFKDSQGNIHKFAADLAVLKLDFSVLYQTEIPRWISYRNFFETNVAHKDVQFNSATSTEGYILGFPGSHKSDLVNPKVGMINLKINSLFTNNNFETSPFFTPPSVIYDLPSANNNIDFQGQNYYFMGAIYNIDQLNLQPGSSGSIFVQANPTTKEVYLNGIYWGVNSVISNFSNQTEQKPRVTDSYGQITKFIADGHYNLIGGATTKESFLKTPDHNSFCATLAVQQTKQDRMPDFC